MPTTASRGYASRIAPPPSGRESLGESRAARSASPAATVPQLLRGVDDALSLLRARGFPAGTQLLAERYARLLSGEALDLHETRDEDRLPDENPHRPRGGFHARDPAGARYWIVGRRAIPGADRLEIPGVVVPGVPDRAFDRIVLVRFDAGFGIEFAGSARASSFLRAAEYEEEANEWLLGATDPFWSTSRVENLTALFRATARRIDHPSAGESPTVRIVSSTEASTTRAMKE